jgi:hypothetical protein
MVKVTFALAVESRCAIAAQSAIWVQTRNVCIAPGKRLGLGGLDGVIKIRGWGISEIKEACKLVVVDTALRWIGCSG